MKRFIICTMALMSGFCMNAQQWTPEQAQEWWDSQEWPVGCCYVPSYAINQFEMWQEDTFDIDTISKELKEAAWLGFNIVRVYLHEDLWHQDKDGFKSRIDEFLAIADVYSKSVEALITKPLEVLSMLASISAMIYEVYNIFVLMRVYRIFAPNSSFVLTLLSIFIEPAQSIIFFVIRKKPLRNMRWQEPEQSFDTPPFGM